MGSLSNQMKGVSNPNQVTGAADDLLTHSLRAMTYSSSVIFLTTMIKIEQKVVAMMEKVLS